MPSTAAFELWRCCLVFSKGFGVEMLNTIVFKKLFPPQDLAGKGLWDREQPQRAATWGQARRPQCDGERKLPLQSPLLGGKVW